MAKIKGRPEGATSSEARECSGSAADAKFDIKSHVAKTLIEAMQKGETPWQKPWSSQSLRPTNATSLLGYRGINRILLSLARFANGATFADNRWVTYQQAQAKGWQVRGGEKGTMIVKVVEIDPTKDRGQGGPERDPGVSRGAGEQSAVGLASDQLRKPVALRHYFVFNAEQVDGIPPLERATGLAFDPIARADAVVEALKEQTNLVIVHGGNQACYVPAHDEVHLPPKKNFKSAYDLYSVTLHECGHSTMAPHRMNRAEAYAKRWGDEAYALEELTVEISAAILCAELGLSDQVSEAQREKHLANHAGYLQSWIKVLSNDPFAIFTAAKAADKVSEYVLNFQSQAVAMEPHKEWIAEFEGQLVR